MSGSTAALRTQREVPVRPGRPAVEPDVLDPVSGAEAGARLHRHPLTCAYVYWRNPCKVRACRERKPNRG